MVGELARASSGQERLLHKLSRSPSRVASSSCRRNWTGRAGPRTIDQSEKSFLRMLYYPETSVEPFQSRVRSATHTDYGCMTLLFNDEGEGLQICDANGEFRYAPRLLSCAIVNGMYRF